MATTRTRMTLEEFLARPDIDERRLELIDGEVCEKVSPRFDHGEIEGFFFMHLVPYGYPSPEARAVIPPSETRTGMSLIPDAAFYRHARPVGGGYMRTPPDIVLEVRSPSQSRAALRAKVDMYLDFGVRSVWVADMDRIQSEVYEDGGRTVYGEGDVIRTAVVPELELPVADLFARTDRK